MKGGCCPQGASACPLEQGDHHGPGEVSAASQNLTHSLPARGGFYSYKGPDVIMAVKRRNDRTYDMKAEITTDLTGLRGML